MIEPHHHHSDDILEPKTDWIVFHNFLPIDVTNEELIEQPKSVDWVRHLDDQREKLQEFAEEMSIAHLICCLMSTHFMVDLILIGFKILLLWDIWRGDVVLNDQLVVNDDAFSEELLLDQWEDLLGGVDDEDILFESYIG